MVSPAAVSREGIGGHDGLEGVQEAGGADGADVDGLSETVHVWRGARRRSAKGLVRAAWVFRAARAVMACAAGTLRARATTSAVRALIVAAEMERTASSSA